MSENSAIKPLICPISKDENCSICLEKINNRACTSTCLHSFCFGCLLKWSQVKWECPLCKTKFNRIFHNIRNNKDYEVHHNVIATSNEEVLEVNVYPWSLDIDSDDTGSIFSLMEDLFHGSDSDLFEELDAITDDEYEEEYDEEDEYDDEDEDDEENEEDDDFSDDDEDEEEEDQDDESDEETDDEFDGEGYDEEFDEEEAEEEEYDVEADDGSVDSSFESYDEEEMEDEEYDEDQEMYEIDGEYEYFSDDYDELDWELYDFHNTWYDGYD